MIFDTLFDAVAQKRNPSVVGLDTMLDYLPADMLARFDASQPFESAEELLVEFNRGIIDATCDIVPAVKLQIAFYEMYGWQGIRAYQRSIEYAKQKGLIVIADAKRNDIGSTAAAYAKAFLGSTPLPGGGSKQAFGADILTVTGYLGEDGIKPFAELGKEGKGIFVLAKTSNPSSGQLQDQTIDGVPVYEVMGKLIEQWGAGLEGKRGYSAVGAVVGATYPEQGERLRKALPHTPFLLPGYGAQGATGDDLGKTFDADGLGAVVNASRSIICAYQKMEGMGYADAARKAALDMQTDILASLQNAGRLSY